MQKDCYLFLVEKCSALGGVSWERNPIISSCSSGESVVTLENPRSLPSSMIVSTASGVFFSVGVTFKKPSHRSVMLKKKLGIVICLFLLLLLCFLDSLRIGYVFCDQSSFFKHIQYYLGLKLVFCCDIILFSYHKLKQHRAFHTGVPVPKKKTHYQDPHMPCGTIDLPTVRKSLSPVAYASGTALPNRIYKDILSVSTPSFKKIIDFMMVLQNY